MAPTTAMTTMAMRATTKTSKTATAAVAATATMRLKPDGGFDQREIVAQVAAAET